MTSIAANNDKNNNNGKTRLQKTKRGMRRVDGQTFIVTFQKKKLEEFTTEEAIEVDVYCQTDSSTSKVVLSRTKDQDDNYVIDEAIKIIASKRKEKYENEKIKKREKAKNLFMEYLSTNSKDDKLLLEGAKLWPENLHIRVSLTSHYLKNGKLEMCIRHCKRLVTEARRNNNTSAAVFEELGTDISAIVSNAYKIMGDALVQVGEKKYKHAINAYVLSLRENESNAKARKALEQLRVSMNEKSEKDAEEKVEGSQDGLLDEEEEKKRKIIAAANVVGEIEDLLSHHQMVSRDTNFKFQCTMCGECCRQADNIFLSPTDIWRMARTPSLWKQFHIRTSMKLRKKFKKSFHWTVKNGLPICYLRPIKSETGRCHYSYPLYHVNGTLLSYDETVKEGLLEEEVYTPVKPEEYNLTEEEELAAMAKFQEDELDEINTIGVTEEKNEGSADDAGDDEDSEDYDDDTDDDEDDNNEGKSTGTDKVVNKKRKDKKKKGKSLPVSVLNSYNRQALGCALGEKNMPNMCAGYPIAKELSWADFWHVRETKEEKEQNADVYRTKRDHDGEKIVIVKTDACEGFYPDNMPRTQPFTNVNAVPAVAREQPLDDFIKHNDLDRRWEETDWFMKLIDEVSSSGIIDALNDDKEAKRNFQTKLVNIWFNPDKLANDKTIGLQGSWKTVARAVDAATKKLVDEFRAKYVLEQLD